MNWTGGKLQRHSKSNLNKVTKVQKEHFAKARLQPHRGSAVCDPYHFSIPDHSTLHSKVNTESAPLHDTFPSRVAGSQAPNPDLSQIRCQDDQPHRSKYGVDTWTTPTLSGCCPQVDPCLKRQRNISQSLTHSGGTGNSLEAVKLSLLAQEDWLTIVPAKPMLFPFDSQTGTRRIGRQRKFTTRLGVGVRPSYGTIHSKRGKGIPNTKQCENRRMSDENNEMTETSVAVSQTLATKIVSSFQDPNPSRPNSNNSIGSLLLEKYEAYVQVKNQPPSLTSPNIVMERTSPQSTSSCPGPLPLNSVRGCLSFDEVQQIASRFSKPGETPPAATITDSTNTEEKASDGASKGGRGCLQSTIYPDPLAVPSAQKQTIESMSSATESSKARCPEGPGLGATNAIRKSLSPCTDMSSDHSSLWAKAELVPQPSLRSISMTEVHSPIQKNESMDENPSQVYICELPFTSSKPYGLSAPLCNTSGTTRSVSVARRTEPSSEVDRYPSSEFPSAFPSRIFGEQGTSHTSLPNKECHQMGRMTIDIGPQGHGMIFTKFKASKTSGDNSLVDISTYAYEEWVKYTFSNDLDKVEQAFQPPITPIQQGRRTTLPNLNTLKEHSRFGGLPNPIRCQSPYKRTRIDDATSPYYVLRTSTGKDINNSSSEALYYENEESLRDLPYHPLKRSRIDRPDFPGRSPDLLDRIYDTSDLHQTAQRETPHTRECRKTSSLYGEQKKLRLFPAFPRPNNLRAKHNQIQFMPNTNHKFARIHPSECILSGARSAEADDVADTNIYDDFRVSPPRFGLCNLSDDIDQCFDILESASVDAFNFDRSYVPDNMQRLTPIGRKGFVHSSNGSNVLTCSKECSLSSSHSLVRCPKHLQGIQLLDCDSR